MERLMVCRSRAAAGPLFAGVACMAAFAALAQDLPTLTEVVEVRVVNVDVVVTDADGTPVRGLERDDFELRVDGEPRAVEYFSAVVDGSTPGTPTLESDPATLPYLAIVFDGRTTRPAAARRTIETLADRLDGLLASTRAVMVLRQGTKLVVEQSMTRDRQLLYAAFDRLISNREPALDVGDRLILLRQLESPGLPPVLQSPESELQIELEDDTDTQRAQQILHQIRIQAEVERRAALESARQLSLLSRSMAGLPGRKAILLLGRGLQRRPGEDLFRLWWNRFSEQAPQIGVMNIDAEIAQYRGSDLLDALIDDANAHRVTFYSHDPTGPSVAGSSAEFARSVTNLEIARGEDAMRDSLVDLSLATGGIGRVPSGVGSLLDEMEDGFGTYYSLGFTPEGIARGRVRVRVRHPGLRVRYLRRFVARTAAQELEEATLATLLTGAEDNSLQVGVDVGGFEAQEDGSFLVTLLIKVPMTKVSLLPQKGSHVGRLTFVVLAQGADGGLSQPATGEVPIEIANAELRWALGQIAGYRMKLRTSGGEQLLAIGVRDEVARQDATLSLSLAPNRGL